MNLLAATSTFSSRVILVDTDNAIYIWSDKKAKEGPDPEILHLPSPTNPQAHSEVSQVALGSSFALFLSKDGRLFSWGKNNWGQLGRGDNAEQPGLHSVKLPEEDSEIRSIHCGGTFSAVVTKNGTLYAWGGNTYCQLAQGDHTGRYIPTKVFNLPPVSLLACGWAHSLALCEDGVLYGWGYNEDGQVGPPSETVPLPSPIEIPEPFTKICCGSCHNFGITKNGDLYSWGWNHVGQQGIHTTNERATSPTFSRGGVRAVVASDAWSMILTEEGTLATTGQNTDGELGVVITASSTHLFLKIPDLENVISFGCGYRLGYAITSNGKFYSWGKKGNFGPFSETPIEIPVKKLRISMEVVHAIWGDALKWLFLGKKDSGSSFYVIPLEVFFHLLGVVILGPSL
jgi:alpha-tubulin suppressor-like RCC1 family protein